MFSQRYVVQLKTSLPQRDPMATFAFLIVSVTIRASLPRNPQNDPAPSPHPEAKENQNRRPTWMRCPGVPMQGVPNPGKLRQRANASDRRSAAGKTRGLPVERRRQQVLCHQPLNEMHIA